MDNDSKPSSEAVDSGAEAVDRSSEVNSGRRATPSDISASAATVRVDNVNSAGRKFSPLQPFDELTHDVQVPAEDDMAMAMDMDMGGAASAAFAQKPASFLPGEGEEKLLMSPKHPKTKSVRGAHNRNVSWGNLAGSPGLSPRPAAPNLQQPSLADDAPVSHISFEEGGSVLYSSENRPNNSKRVTIENLVHQSPMEAEAETYILRALEERDPTRARADSSAPSVLNNIPDEAIRNMTEESKASEVNATSPPNGEAHPSNRSLGVTSRSKPKHRRTATVEDQLADLTSAIDAFHNMDVVIPANQDPPSPLGRGRLNTFDSAAIPGLELPLSSAETFQQNASILLHRTKAAQDNANGTTGAANDDASQAPSLASSNATSASKRWRKLKTVLKVGTNTKKDDGDGDGNGDVIIEGGQGMEEDEEIAAGIAELGVLQEHVDGTSERQTSSGRPVKSPNLTGNYSPFFTEVTDFFGPRRTSIYVYCKVMTVYVMLPAIGIAAILFHLADNPPTGILQNGGRAINGTVLNKDGEEVNPEVASASWWIIFLAVRQLITFTMSKATEIVIIDFLSIRSRFMIRLMGPWVTLFVLQSRGWPFLLFMWAVFDFTLLSGSKAFFAHWLYWQSLFKLFNESNPSGNVVDSDTNHRILAIAASVGGVVAIKRFWMGQYLGRQTFAQYADKLTTVMKKILLVSEVASLGRGFERYVGTRGVDAGFPHVAGLDEDALLGLMRYSEDGSVDDRSFQRSKSTGTIFNDIGNDAVSMGEMSRVVDPDDRNPLTGRLNSSQKTKITQLLGAWEEPSVASKPKAVASVDAILRFRTALSLLKASYPFSALFGLADTRESCVVSSQETYERLLLRSPGKEVLNFEILALLGVKKDGSLDQDKLQSLVRLFRPDREGELRLIDFVKSVDAIYKELRLLRAAVANSSKIDEAFETIINIIFYVIVVTIILSQLGFDPLALFLSISGVVLAFAFMIGSASSKYFEGILFVLIRRPYTIGDGIHVSNIEAETSYTGSAWWTVEDINLFSTSVVFMFTNERATLSNGSLANSRIINVTRSQQAQLYILFKFPIDAPYEKLEVFHSAVERYVRNRPREWLAMGSFRATGVHADKGYIEYIVTGQHRESWSNWGALMLSKAQLMSFCLELSKKLGMTYRSPALPVDLNVVQAGSLANAASLLNQGSAPPGSGMDNDDQANFPGMDMSPDLASLQARFAPAPPF